MDLEQIASYLLFFHALTGGLALLAGLIPIVAKNKGNRLHIIAGKIFVYNMLASGFIAMFITFIPNHENAFLFGVGLFSSYLVYTGNRAIKYKTLNLKLSYDKYIAVLMSLTGAVMIIYPIITMNTHINIISIMLGIAAIVFGYRDFINFKKPELLQKKWLKLHIGKIVGGYISATTAFIVTNSFFSGIWGWFLPSIIGSAYIAVWIRKVNKKTTLQH